MGNDDRSVVGWGVLGTGVIAGKFAAAVEATPTSRLLAVGSRSNTKAEAFAARWGADRPYGSYDQVLADPDVDAVYIATPHPDHKRSAIAAAAAGKHLLVEKPLTMNSADTEEVLAAAERHGVFLLEGFQYRSHPQTAALTTLLADGAIGEVRALRGSFGFHAPFDPRGRLFAPELGGGGILDVGCYPVSMSVLVARSIGLDPSDVRVAGGGHVGSTGVDEWAAATLVFDGRFVAQVDTAVSLELGWSVTVFGSEGSIHVPAPWLPARTSEVVLSRRGADPERRTTEAAAEVFTLLVETFAEHVRGGSALQSSTMPWDDTRATMQILDRWREAVGVTYPGER